MLQLHCRALPELGKADTLPWLQCRAVSRRGSQAVLFALRSGQARGAGQQLDLPTVRVREIPAGGRTIHVPAHHGRVRGHWRFHRETSHPGHMAEMPCSAGKYSSAFLCLTCPADRFQSLPGALSCSDCDPGKYTNGANGSTVCAVCEAGKEMSGDIGARVCVDCGAGQVSTSAGANCTACGAGKYANSDKTECVLCPKGKFSSTIGAFATDHSTCQNCSAGRYSLATGVSDVSGCTNCSAGKYGTVAGSTDDSSCKNCGSGRFQTHEGSTRCQKCDPGRNASPKRLPAFCAAGKRLWRSKDASLTAQMVGFSGAEQETIRVQRVQRSWSQRWAIFVGSARCLSCVPGKFGRGCRDCPEGLLSATRGANELHRVSRRHHDEWTKRLAPSARGAISADSAPTARARNATRDALPTPEAAPSAPSASPAKLPILRARRARIRLGLRRRIALSASISTTERTSRSGAAKHV